MRGYLFDENLPSRLTFTPGLPVVSASVLGSSPTDTQVWDYARSEALVIVTEDADFSGRMILHAPPPWVVHLRLGNLRRREFHNRLARAWPQVELLPKSNKLVNVHADRVEGIS
jgi:predicted nuclease of predicted toxin-antitoxin system